MNYNININQRAIIMKINKHKYKCDSCDSYFTWNGESLCFASLEEIDKGKNVPSFCSAKCGESWEKEQVLKRFMQEFFPFDEFLDLGFFTKEMKGDYKAQADRVCKFFGHKTVYEYGAKETRAHISYVKERPKDEPFVTVIPSIYE